MMWDGFGGMGWGWIGLGMVHMLLFWVLVIGAIISGILNIIGGLQAAPRSWWTVLLGVLKIVLAALLLENPLVGTLALVPALGILAIVNGIVPSFGPSSFAGDCNSWRLREVSG